MILYKTVDKFASDEQIIEKSRFIAYAAPAASKEEADLFIAEIKSKHRDATHNVPAMVIGDKFQIQWASDDGEPQGTSGAPIVQMLVKEGITNVVVVVTRYFGGIKLGTGGLVRAYTSSAKLGIEAAGLCQVKDMYVCQVCIDYTFLSKLQNMAQSRLFDILDIEYLDKVQVRITTDPDKEKELKDMLSNLTSGNYDLKSEAVEQVKTRI